MAETAGPTPAAAESTHAAREAQQVPASAEVVLAAANTGGISARLANADAASRPRLVSQLQRTHGNEYVQRVIQRLRTRHRDVIDNGVLNRDVHVVLGNLSGTLPASTYVEVAAHLNATTWRVKVWSGYGGQVCEIPASSFQHQEQRPDGSMDRVDMGAYGRIPAPERLPFAASARVSHRPESHGVQDNGCITNPIARVTLGGQTGTLPSGTYVEVVRVNPDGSRTLRVWSGFGGQETVLSAADFARGAFRREQRSDNRMDVPDLTAHLNVPLADRFALTDQVRLQVIDNGVLTTDLDTTEAALPTLRQGTYVEVMEYRNSVVVLRPHSGVRAGLAVRFVAVDRAAFAASFRHEPQVNDEEDAHGQPRRGRVDQDVAYARRTEPLWGPGGPQLEDIRQGAIGTCWVLAAAGALLRQDPTIITNQILQGNSPTAATFQVHLYPSAGSGLMAGPIRTVTVDRYLPVWTVPDPGEDAAAYAGARRALWPAVLEKAFAEVFLGYDDVGRGEQSQYAMRILTGNVVSGDPHTPTTIRPNGLPSEAALLARILALESVRAALIFSTGSSRGDYISRPLHLFKDHAYVFTHTDGNRVQLFNPHGTEQPLPLTMAQVRRYCDEIVVREAR